ncbi:DegQ family serine endoprotease [Methylocaldum szegediense]|uniref:Periplasmic serine endoprotease n=1 Tax=Methylocaldum szegediense TaxID=73780 RepID=A0ABM9HYX9_9GAMM|nr:DegQ family serine endoprotease [Methylocaldum szegediense]CAI8779810.1 periplasmic serine endoprotease [Methylocaldum szegediense]
MTNIRGLLPLLLGGLLFLSNAAYAAWPTSVDGQPLPSLAPMLKRATPAVVNISTRTQIQEAEHPLLRDPFFRYFFDIPNQPRRRETSSLGSGVIVDARRGYILTNNHVIDKADEIMVTLSDGRHLSAKLVGADPESDIAVIKVEADNLTELPVADSSQLQVGDFVVAIGNPFGLGQTVTSGIISALGRSGLGIEGYEDFIQTDASINPGNSGGALVNLRGELIGINTAILAPSGGNVGIGFAIPSNMATSIMTALIEHGEIRRGLLGVTIQDLTPELAQAFGLTRSHGAVITGVQPDSPAAKAKLEPGDVVLAINDRPVRNSMDVRNAIGMQQIGDKVEIEVLHKGETVVRVARIAEPKISREDGKKVHPKLSGTMLSDTEPNARVQGVRVEKIHTASYAYRAGLRPGDVIVMANRERVGNLRELKAVVSGSAELLLNVQRENGSFFLLLR